MLFNIQKKMPRIGSRARVIYIELGFPGTNIIHNLDKLIYSPIQL